MADMLEISQGNFDSPISITIDTNVEGAILLAKLLEFSVGMEMDDIYDMTDLYAQVMNQLEQFGSIVEYQEVKDNND